MSTEAKQRYRAPTIYREVEVDLNDFTDEQIVAYLRHRGYAVSGEGGEPSEDEAGGPVPGGGPLVIDQEDLSRISTLTYCGQKQYAAEFVLELVGRHIGRSLL
jgi:hypothetical protein